MAVGTLRAIFKWVLIRNLTFWTRSSTVPNFILVSSCAQLCFKMVIYPLTINRETRLLRQQIEVFPKLMHIASISTSLYICKEQLLSYKETKNIHAKLRNFTTGQKVGYTFYILISIFIRHSSNMLKDFQYVKRF